MIFPLNDIIALIKHHLLLHSKKDTVDKRKKLPCEEACVCTSVTGTSSIYGSVATLLYQPPIGNNGAA